MQFSKIHQETLNRTNFGLRRVCNNYVLKGSSTQNLEFALNVISLFLCQYLYAGLSDLVLVSIMLISIVF